MYFPILAQSVQTESVNGYVMISLVYLGLSALVFRRASASFGVVHNE